MAQKSKPTKAFSPSIHIRENHPSPHGIKHSGSRATVPPEVIAQMPRRRPRTGQNKLNPSSKKDKTINPPSNGGINSSKRDQKSANSMADTHFFANDGVYNMEAFYQHFPNDPRTLRHLNSVKKSNNSMAQRPKPTPLAGKSSKPSVPVSTPKTDFFANDGVYNMETFYKHFPNDPRTLRHLNLVKKSTNSKAQNSVKKPNNAIAQNPKPIPVAATFFKPNVPVSTPRKVNPPVTIQPVYVSDPNYVPMRVYPRPWDLDPWYYERQYQRRRYDDLIHKMAASSLASAELTTRLLEQQTKMFTSPCNGEEPSTAFSSSNDSVSDQSLSSVIPSDSEPFSCPPSNFSVPPPVIAAPNLATTATYAQMLAPLPSVPPLGVFPISVPLTSNPQARMVVPREIKPPPSVGSPFAKRPSPRFMSPLTNEVPQSLPSPWRPLIKRSPPPFRPGLQTRAPRPTRPKDDSLNDPQKLPEQTLILAPTETLLDEQSDCGSLSSLSSEN